MGSFRDMDDDSRQALLDDSVYQARSLMEEIANKFIWDVFFHMMNPDQETLDKILNALAKNAIDHIREDTAEDAIESDIDSDDMEFVTELNDEAIKIAFEKFREARSTPILTKEFSIEVIRAIGVNLMRAAALVDEEEDEG